MDAAASPGPEPSGSGSAAAVASDLAGAANTTSDGPASDHGDGRNAVPPPAGTHCSRELLPMISSAHGCIIQCEYQSILGSRSY